MATCNISHPNYSYCIFSSAWLCQQSSWNRNSSVVRPSVRPSVRLWHRLSLKLFHGFLSNFSCGFSWATCPEVFFIFEKKNSMICFILSLTWGTTGAKISKRYFSLKSLLILSNFFWKFFSVVLTKVLFWIFEILDFWFFRIFFFFVFVNMGPHESQNFKTLLLPQISFESFQPFPEFSSQWSSQKYCFGFLKF